MTLDEVKKLIFILKATYPNHYRSFNDADYKNLSAAWAMVLEDYTYSQASAGLKIYLASDTKGFPPSPGQVIDCIHKAKHNEQMTALEAWTLVRTAIGRSTYYAEEEFNNLPKICQKVLGSADALRHMAQLPSDTVGSVEQSHFIRGYEAMVKRQAEEVKIPQRIRPLTQATITSIEEKRDEQRTDASGY